ncbi:MAG TPA: hypothetical protein VF187_09630, partial [Gemmatimonadales bacterium]
MKHPAAPVLILLACIPGILPGQKPRQPPKPVVPAIALATEGLAGQAVTVLPLTMVVSDRRIPGSTGAAARARTMQWADSLLHDALSERAPEVNWIFPPELRRVARRAPGLLPSPDRMGQSVMRAPNLKEMPDPLRTYVRQLLALAGGARFALIPASLQLSPAGGDSLKAELSAVLTDGRVGRVVWRTLAVGTGETAADAY